MKKIVMIDMTNDEKKKYLNLKIAFQSTPFVSELEKRNDFISMIPKTLYKYRKFDEFTFDMIENDYVYLTPSGMLDDPFDCLTNADMSKIFENTNGTLTTEAVDFIVEVVFNHPHSQNLDKKQMLELIDDCIVNGQVDNIILKSKLDDIDHLTFEQKDLLLNVLINFQNVIKTIIEDNNLKNLLKIFLSSKEKIGVCSFTTKRDNKPMWSLYADQYKGYCIEYETPLLKDILSNLCPVIYKEEVDNNIVKAIIQFAIETIIRFASNGKIDTNMGCFTELLCSKDINWEYQDEWRLIGDAKSKGHPFKIRNVYLGFNVSNDNEKLIIDISKRKGFGVYKMSNPSGNSKISYYKIS